MPISAEEGSGNLLKVEHIDTFYGHHQALAVSIAITNVDGRLNQNAKDMLNMQVRNRVSYVQDLMQDAQNLTDLSEHINNTVLAMQEEGQLDLAELNTSREKSDALLTAIAPELVSTLRAKPSLWY